MMMIADLDAQLFHVIDHFLTDLVVAVKRCIHVIAFDVLAGHAIGIIKIHRQGIFTLCAGNGVTCRIAIGIHLHGIKEMEFQLGNPG